MKRLLLLAAVGLSFMARGEVELPENSSYLLPSLDEGPWPCVYYLLNYNSDLSQAQKALWYSVEEDESDWIPGYGPFSNDANIFYTTEWPSQVRPILIRRHFNLSSKDVEDINSCDTYLICSYDENPTIYLNGTSLWSASGWNDNNYASLKLSSRQKARFVEGDNLLAVSLQQGGGGGHIDYALYAIIPDDSQDENGIEEVLSETCEMPVYGIDGIYIGKSLSNLPTGIYIRGGRKIRIIN